MRFTSSLTALACAAALTLTACGGGGGDTSAPPVAVSSPAALSMTDTVTGTGATAASGRRVTVNYTGWLYSATAADHKGTQFESSSFAFTLGQGQVIAGWEQGLPGMRVGGKRTLLIPASLAYGSGGRGPIPPNSGLVFDVELTKVE
ncbi:FKBP-type peptidyl-prolyl cis-trans isomerase [Massilia sp. Dwa41.01b]|uniref:FKBP-type peptidyl-prolyl cis-trans isomerase n=1 Tax=unclassified Massilia TaxID=2609279 RepID=UPI001602D3F3|nr:MULTISPECIES: FKBP-type peptidyl-prolyl cis-trans isomerase [unclassified Massilia]QNA90866.1 FKBP-type peptidyl-prolyl cis-trans isomerase [Massilia sp. Dwa41.01b]QNA98105.1 FKBP-type peptidyl-prolyl cis-trans isomerase [Massilia sp. Se16.2.3]